MKTKRLNGSKGSALLNSTILILAIALMTLVVSTARAEWSLDLSRRTQQMRKSELNKDAYGRDPASVRTYEGEEPPMDESSRLESNGSTGVNAIKEEASFLGKVFDAGEPTQDIVILNTERGFVPNTIRVRRDGRYMVHVVNVNEKEKNVSFILDGFSEHHATFFGKVKSFKLEPKKEGVYSFLSPETAVEGKFIVFANGPDAPPKLRVPATAANGVFSAPIENAAP
jgi:hypothetical protein